MTGKVLIIDDEKDLLELLSEFFSMEGYEVLSALNGEDALNLYNSNHDIKAIISDKNLPDMTGNDILNKLKEGGEYPPFFFSTGSVEYTESMAISDGATGLFSKPFDLEEVVEAVKKLSA
jgi:CheY-like chemotaxis protein